MNTELKTEITVDQIIQDFGDFYLDAGQNEANLHMLPFESFGTKDAFTIVPTDDTVLRESNVEVTELLQQYQDEFTPKGELEFKPVKIDLFKMKIDQEFNPHKLQRIWLGFLTSNNTDVTTWPFIRWFIEKYLMMQAEEDIEMKAIFGGVYEAPQEGVPGSASKVMNGLDKIFTDFETAGDLVPITMGSIEANDDDFVTQIEEFVQAIPEKYRYMNMELNMSRTLRDKFKRGTRTKYKANYDPSDIKNYRVADAENITVVGRASHQNSNRIWCSPKYNALLGVKGFENVKGFEIEKSKRKVAIYTEWWMGAGFINPELIFINDTI